MRKIPNRERIFYYLYWHQSEKCACGCGRKLILWAVDIDEIVDPHHCCKDDEGNNENFPDFQQSMFNIQLVRRGCHAGKGEGKLRHFTPYQASVRQKTLEKPKWKAVRDFINGRSNHAK